MLDTTRIAREIGRSIAAREAFQRLAGPTSILSQLSAQERAVREQRTGQQFFAAMKRILFEQLQVKVSARHIDHVLSSYRRWSVLYWDVGDEHVADIEEWRMKYPLR
jgi:hypothetical protein